MDQTISSFIFTNTNKKFFSIISQCMHELSTKTKLHRVITRMQSNWPKTLCRLSVLKMKKLNPICETNVFKLMNNAVSGTQTMEN